MKIYGPDTVIIVRAQLLVDDRDNSNYRDWANAELITVNHCMVEPYKMAEKLNSEDMVDREFASTSIRIFAPPETVFYYTDRVRFQDLEYVVLGVPGLWHDFQGKNVYRGVIARALLG